MQGRRGSWAARRVEARRGGGAADGTTRRIACDTVVFTGDWIPDHELARAGGLALDPGTRGPHVDAAYPHVVARRVRGGQPAARSGEPRTGPRWRAAPPPPPSRASSRAAGRRPGGNDRRGSRPGGAAAELDRARRARRGGRRRTRFVTRVSRLPGPWRLRGAAGRRAASPRAASLARPEPFPSPGRALGRGACGPKAARWSFPRWPAPARSEPMTDDAEQDRKAIAVERRAGAASLGYKQELLRKMSGFSNFAISMSIICILAGGVTSFHQGLSSVGGAAFGLGWPLVCLFSLTRGRHHGPGGVELPDRRAACTTGPRSWAAGAGAGRRPGSTCSAWWPRWPPSTWAPAVHARLRGPAARAGARVVDAGRTQALVAIAGVFAICASQAPDQPPRHPAHHAAHRLQRLLDPGRRARPHRGHARLRAGAASRVAGDVHRTSAARAAATCGRRRPAWRCCSR